MITENPDNEPAVFCEVCFADFTAGERAATFPSGHLDAFGCEHLAGRPVHCECISKGIAQIVAARNAGEQRIAKSAATTAAVTATYNGIEGSINAIEGLVARLMGVQ